MESRGEPESSDEQEPSEDVSAIFSAARAQALLEQAFTDICNDSSTPARVGTFLRWVQNLDEPPTTQSDHWLFSGDFIGLGCLPHEEPRELLAS